MKHLSLFAVLTGLLLGSGRPESKPVQAAASAPLQYASAADLRALRKGPLEQPRLVHFWATWCTPCRKEFPHLLSLDQLFSEAGLELITVSLDGADDESEVVAFLANHKNAYRNLLYKGKNAYGMLKAFDRKWKELLPYTVLIDVSGEIIYRREGQVDLPELREAIRPLLEAPGEQQKRP